MKTVIDGKNVDLIAMNQDTGKVDQAALAFNNIQAAAISASGTLSCPAGIVTSGVYTPVVAVVSGTPSNITVNTHSFLRIGAVVAVAGSLSILTADTGPFVISMTLPVGGVFVRADQASGTAVEAGFPSVGSITADPASAKVLLSASAADDTQQIWVFHFTYQVL